VKAKLLENKGNLYGMYGVLNTTDVLANNICVQDACAYVQPGSMDGIVQILCTAG